jgi:hypothetical protein
MKCFADLYTFEAENGRLDHLPRLIRKNASTSILINKKDEALDK